MPLKTAEHDHLPLCYGHSWRVGDVDLLAEVLAALLIGEHESAAAIRANTFPRYTPKDTRQTIDDIIARLIIPADPQYNWKRYHRDGLIFQMISWCAAVQLAPLNTLVRTPHVRSADKGLDGISLEPPNTGNTMWHAVISEEKATETPRRLINDEVWPELAILVGGGRRPEIKADASTLLSQIPDPAQRAVILKDVMWQGGLHYRVCVTVDPNCDCDATPNALFSGYDVVVPGPMGATRRGDVLELPRPIREWMEEFCMHIINHLEICVDS